MNNKVWSTFEGKYLLLGSIFFHLIVDLIDEAKLEAKMEVAELVPLVMYLFTIIVQQGT